MSLSMVIEALILVLLIMVFLASFCGLLQKIRHTYEQDRNNTENSTDSSIQDVESGVFPGSPPPYNDFYIDPPPKYEEVIKAQQQEKGNRNNIQVAKKTISAPVAVHTKITHEFQRV